MDRYLPWAHDQRSARHRLNVDGLAVVLSRKPQHLCKAHNTGVLLDEHIFLMWTDSYPARRRGAVRKCGQIPASPTSGAFGEIEG